MILFEESIKSKYTARNYNSHLKQFLEFLKADSTDMLLLYSSSELQHELENYLIELKQTANPNSIPSRFKGIRHFCVINGIEVKWNILYKMFPQRQKTQALRSYTSYEVKQIVSNTTSIRDRALIHFLASTGARIGVFDHDLLIGHMRKMPHNSYAVLLYAGHVEEYWSFLTPQAAKILKKYHDGRKKNGEVFCDQTPIFAAGRTISKQIGWSGARSIVYRAASKTSARSLKQNGRYDVQINHGFRKRFNTVLKLDNTVNYNIAEKLMGHKNGLDGTYLTPTLEEMFLEFSKVMHKLEI